MNVTLQITKYVKVKVGNSTNWNQLCFYYFVFYNSQGSTWRTMKKSHDGFRPEDWGVTNWTKLNETKLWVEVFLSRDKGHGCTLYVLELSLRFLPAFLNGSLLKDPYSLLLRALRFFFDNFLVRTPIYRS